ncbi:MULTISPECIES: NAD(P)/FAD-dependent oxidoreductase [Micromonospora]|uniref:Ferredoxin--NADP reductase n=1 Tax=Micromonospora rifamycinica TaxID=291594 RepID=A0A109INP3_9ACTN|nr:MULTISPECIES: NAD(P)/FAD-dependent oxidoreductase [Micromonospora]KWV33881.1 ferredoxin--NADP(+) reductase [Micromonospora rifamycinica]WFE63958.1 NAD(P)/FAD-dependent oxidoreductase [Micromonospora sp. WMMD714]SCG61353.1 thioredoxin reductase (NADPH) [Micromonospora rifamycinica]
MREVDVAVIGAGPTGLFAAYYAGFRGLSVAVVDALPEPGGQITAMYPEKLILDVAGFPAVKGRDLVANLVAQAAPYHPEYLLGTRAEKLSHADGRPVLGLSGGEELRCGAVVVTGGLGSFTPRPLPVADSFLGGGIVYFVPDPAALADRDVLIVGGGDSAFDWAATLQPLARSVTLVHRRERFRAHAGTVARVLSLPVRVVVNAEVTRLHGDDTVTAAEITVRGGATETLPVDTVVAALGFTADLGPLAEWGLRLDRRHIVVDSAMATSLPRVYAAGDITEYPGKVRLIATGFGEAATAVNNAAVAIDPAAHLFPGHSSDAG